MADIASTSEKAYVITGPTSGYGLQSALELAKHGTVILVGRDRAKLSGIHSTIESRGGRALSVVCDLSDLAGVRRAAAEIAALKLPVAGLLNNAGIMQAGAQTQSVNGWDLTFATNHLGPFALTEALTPHLADGTNVVFIVSAVEDPERRPAVMAGFRGGRYVDASASARGEWLPGGSTKPGYDAYATSKQAILAATLAFARETPRLRFNAIEPGLAPATGLGNSVGVIRFVQRYLMPVLVPLLMPFIKILTTPKRAARMITKIVVDASGQTGLYFDEGGRPMMGSTQVRDPKFQDRVVAETRALLATASA